MRTTTSRRFAVIVGVTAGAFLGFAGPLSAKLPAEASAPASSRQAVQGTPTGAGDQPPHNSRVPINQRIVDVAAAQKGKPYKWGAEGPHRFDCSGLVQYVHRQVGIRLPRTSDQQRAATRRLPKAGKRPGDLVFFDRGGDVYHVGIYAGSNRMWDAPEPGDHVRLREIWTSSYTVGRAW